MTDEECLEIIQESIHHLVRCSLDDGALAFKEIKESFKKVVKGIKMSYLISEDVTFIYHEDFTVAWIIKDNAIVHISEITIDYVPLIDKEIKTLISEIRGTYNIEYQIELSEQITGLLELKREIL